MFFNAGCLPKTVAPASRPSAFARHHLSVVAPPAIREDGGSRGFQAPECKPPNKLALATGSSSIPPSARVPHPCVFSAQGWETTTPRRFQPALSARSQRFAEDYPHPAHNKSVGEFHDETDNCGKAPPSRFPFRALGAAHYRRTPPKSQPTPPPTRFYLSFNQQLLTNQ